MRKPRHHAGIAFSVMMIALLILTSFAPAVSATADGSKDSGKRLPELPQALKEKVREKLEPLMKTIEEVRTGANYVHGERIVVFKHAVAREKLGEVVGRVKPLSVKDVVVFGPRGEEKVVKLLKFEDKERAKWAESELKKDPSVIYVAKNFKVKVPPIKRVGVQRPARDIP